MADITTDIKPLENTINKIKDLGVKAAETISTANTKLIQTYLGMLSPLSIVEAGIGKLISAYKELAAEGKKIEESAGKVGLSKYQFASLKAVADAAKVSVSEFNKSMNDLKNGKTSVEALTESWKKNANAADLAYERLKKISALVAANEGGLSGAWDRFKTNFGTSAEVQD